MIAFMFIEADRLRNNVSSQRDTIEKQERQEQAQAEIIARKSAQLLTLERVLELNQTFLRRTSMQSIRNACPLYSERRGEQWNDLTYNLCELLDLRREDLVDFLSRFTSLASERASADSHEDFVQLGNSYAALLVQAREQQVGPDFEAWILEGMAYASYRLNNLDQAQNQIRDALSLDPRSAMVASTELKIDCRRRAPSETIRRRYESISAPSPAGSPQRTIPRAIVEDPRYVREDPELLFECRDVDFTRARNGAEGDASDSPGE